MKLSAILQDLKEPSLLLHLIPTKDKSPNTKSHIGGYPYQLKNEPSPSCSCGNKMRFLFQFRVPEQDGIHLYVFYYCFHCQHAEGSKEGFICIEYLNPSEEVMKKRVLMENAYQQAEIILEPVWSLPDWNTLMIYHADLSEKIYSRHKDQAMDVYEEAKDDSIGIITDNEPFSFYGGYPAFIDLPVRPKCTCCGNPMEFWLQLDSTEEFGFIFEDYGTLYLFRCPKTKEVHFLIQ